MGSQVVSRMTINDRRDIVDSFTTVPFLEDLVNLLARAFIQPIGIGHRLKIADLLHILINSALCIIPVYRREVTLLLLKLIRQLDEMMLVLQAFGNTLLLLNVYDRRCVVHRQDVAFILLTVLLAEAFGTKPEKVLFLLCRHVRRVNFVLILAFVIMTVE